LQNRSMLKQMPKSLLLASKPPSKKRRSFLPKSLLSRRVRSRTLEVKWKRNRVSRNEGWTQKRSLSNRGRSSQNVKILTHQPVRRSRSLHKIKSHAVRGCDLPSRLLKSYGPGHSVQQTGALVKGYEPAGGGRALVEAGRIRDSSCWC